MNLKTGIKSHTNSNEDSERRKLTKMLKNSPIPDDQVLSNLGLYLSSKDLSRILFMNFIYKKVINLQGVIFDFGTRWGQNLALFSAFRGIYEPFNRHKKIVGFDTFTGFPSINKKDGTSSLMKKGNIAVTNNYEAHLNKIMESHEALNPVSHIKKFELWRGDATIEIEKYFKKFPETIVALAYFDFDIYEPTKKCLEVIKPHLVKGSLLAFDELNDHDSPGETIALAEVFGLNNIKLRRFPYTSRISYFVVE